MHAAGTLNLPLTLKEVVGVGSKGYPITAVVPLPKGIYEMAKSGRIKEFTGISAPYEEPEIKLQTDVLSLDECVRVLLDYLIENEYIQAQKYINETNGHALKVIGKKKG